VLKLGIIGISISGIITNTVVFVIQNRMISRISEAGPALAVSFKDRRNI
jgi:hypothetical protein